MTPYYHKGQACSKRVGSGNYVRSSCRIRGHGTKVPLIILGLALRPQRYLTISKLDYISSRASVLKTNMAVVVRGSRTETCHYPIHSLLFSPLVFSVFLVFPLQASVFSSSAFSAECGGKPSSPMATLCASSVIDCARLAL